MICRKCRKTIILTWRWVDLSMVMNCTPRDLGTHEPDLADTALVEKWLLS